MLQLADIKLADVSDWSAAAGPWAGVLLDLTIKSTALLVFGGTLALLARRATAAARHLVWMATIVGLLLIPVLTFVLPAWRVLPEWAAASPVPEKVQPVPAPAAGGDAAPAMVRPLPVGVMPQLPDVASAASPVAGAREAVGAPEPARLSWSSLAVCVWVAGVLAALVPVVLSPVLLGRLRRRSSVVRDSAWVRLCDALRAALGLGRRVALLQTPRRSVPMTFGIFWPKILLPGEAESWPAERRRVVLLHELAHVKRWDCLTFLLARVARCVYWFHPLVWVACARLSVERERACDDMVLRAGTRSSEYASELLTIASTFGGSVPGGNAALAMARPSTLEGRLRAILDGKRNRRKLAVTTAGFIVLLLLGVIVPLACLKARGESAKEVGARISAVKEPATEIPATSAHAALPNGVTVELRGIAPSPANEKAWFSPQGDPIAAPYISLDENFKQLDAANLKSVTEFIAALRQSPQPCEFAFTLHGLDHPSQPQYSIEGQHELSAYPAVYKWNNDGTEDWWQYTTLIAALPAKVPGNCINLRVTLASGPFTTGATVPADQPATAVLDGSPVMVSASADTDGSPHFQVDFDAAIHEVRIVAVDRKGREFPNAGNLYLTEGPLSLTEHSTFRRATLGLAQVAYRDIDHLLIRTRTMQWAEFRNVPLEPGLRLPVEVAMGQAGQAAQPATAPAAFGAVKFSGVVIDADTGQPIEHFVIQSGWTGAGDKMLWGGETSSDSGWRGGKFSESASAEVDKKAWLRIIAEGYETQTVTAEAVTVPGEAKGLVVKMTRGVTLKGVVVDHAGKPVAGARVQLTGEHSINALGNGAGDFMTDNAGRFAISGAGKDQGVVVTAKPFMVWHEMVADPAKEVTIQMPEPALFTTHYDIGGAPAAGELRMELTTWDMPTWENVGVSWTTPLVNGAASYSKQSQVTPGVYDVARIKKLTVGDMERSVMLDRANVTLVAGKATELTFVRKAGAAVTGKVVGLNGLAGAFVYVRAPEVSGDPGSETDWKLPFYDGVATGADGAFKTDMLEPGTYKVVAEAYGKDLHPERSGWRLPQLVGMGKVTVPAQGEAGAVTIEMKALEGAAPATGPAAGARLQFRLVAARDDATAVGDDFADGLNPGQTVRVLRPVLMDESAVASAALDSSQRDRLAINLVFTKAGGAAFAKLTKDHVHEGLAILFDGKLLSAPTIQTEILAGKAVITLSRGTTPEEAQRIVNALNAARPAGGAATEPGPAATTATDLPTLADFQKILGKPSDSPEVKALVKRYALREYTKGPSGGFDNYATLPFSLLYNDSKIDRIVLIVGHGTGADPKSPLYTGALPGGVQRTDSPEDVLLRLGPAKAQPERDYLSYDKPSMVLSFDRTTHHLIEIDLDALRQTPPSVPYYTTDEIGEEVINQNGSVDITPKVASLLFDATPTRLRKGWEDHLPSPPPVPNSNGNPRREDTSKFTPPASTEPRARVSAYTPTQLSILIYRPAGTLNGCTYEDNIGCVFVDRSPELEKLFNVQALERTYGMVYRGLKQGDMRGAISDVLGEPDKIEASVVQGASTLIYAGGAVRIEMNGTTINAIRLVSGAAPATQATTQPATRPIKAPLNRDELLAAATKIRAQFTDLEKRYAALANLIQPGMTKDDLLAVLPMVMLPPTVRSGGVGGFDGGIEFWSGNLGWGWYPLEGEYGVEYGGTGRANAKGEREMVLGAAPRILSPKEVTAKRIGQASSSATVPATGPASRPGTKIDVNDGNVRIGTGDGVVEAKSVEIAATEPGDQLQKDLAAMVALEQNTLEQKKAAFKAGLATAEDVAQQEKKVLEARIKWEEEVKAAASQPGEFYIMGQIARPGVYSLTDKKINLLQAMAAAGGDAAKPGLVVTLIHRMEGQETTTRVPLATLLADGSKDTIVQANDIINVAVNERIVPLLQLKADTENQRRDASQRLGKDHPQVKALEEKLLDVAAQLDKEMATAPATSPPATAPAEMPAGTAPGRFYIMGDAVSRPGTYDLIKGVDNILKAIALAGGTTPAAMAKPDEVFVYFRHRIGGRTDVSFVPLATLLKDRTTDLTIQADDIIALYSDERIAPMLAKKDQIERDLATARAKAGPDAAEIDSLQQALLIVNLDLSSEMQRFITAPATGPAAAKPFSLSTLSKELAGAIFDAGDASIDEVARHPKDFPGGILPRKSLPAAMAAFPAGCVRIDPTNDRAVRVLLSTNGVTKQTVEEGVIFLSASASTGLVHGDWEFLEQLYLQPDGSYSAKQAADPGTPTHSGVLYHYRKRTAIPKPN